MVITGVITLVILVLVLGSRANDTAMRKLIGSTSTRRYDAGPIEIVDAESTSLVPYEPEQQVIRIDTGKLARAEAQPTWEASKHTPTRVPRMESDFRVPMAQSLYTAFAFGVMAGLMAWALEWSWRVPVFVMGLSLGLSWLWRLRLIDSLLWKVESITRTDISGDGAIGQPEPQVSYTLANPAQARSTVAQQTRSQADSAKMLELQAFAHRCYTVGTGRRAHNVNPGGSKMEGYNASRGTLMRLGLAEWKNPNNHNAGWTMTTDEATALETIARHVL